MTEKHFDDEEVSLILRHALEPEAGRAEGGGLTLRQLKEIAAEVGIDPSRIEAAAVAVQARRGAGKRRRRGMTARYDVQVDGELSPDRHADILSAIRQAMGRQGIVTSELGDLSWRARDAFGGRYVTIRSGGGSTRIEALGNFRDGALLTGAGGGTAGLAITAILLKAVGGVAALGMAGPLALVAGAAIPGWALYRRLFRREDDALRHAVAEIAASVDADRPGGAPTPEE